MVAEKRGHVRTRHILDIDKVDKVVAPVPNIDGLLFEACAEGDGVNVFLYADKGANVDAVNESGNRPLHVAAYGGYLDIVNFLLKRGADVNALGAAGNTAVLYAAKQNHSRVVKYLLDQQADPNCINEAGWAPLHLAAAKQPGNSETLRVLIAHNTTPSTTSVRSFGARAKTKKVDLECLGPGGFSAVHFAVQACNVEAVAALVGAGVVTTTRDHSNRTPLSLAEALPQPNVGKSGASEGEGEPAKYAILRILNDAIVSKCSWLHVGVSGVSKTRKQQHEWVDLGTDAKPEQRPDNGFSKGLEGRDNAEKKRIEQETVSRAAATAAVNETFPFRQFVNTFQTQNAHRSHFAHDEVQMEAEPAMQKNETQLQPESNPNDRFVVVSPSAETQSTESPVVIDSDSASHDVAAVMTKTGVENTKTESGSEGDDDADIPNEQEESPQNDGTNSGQEEVIEWACDARPPKTFPIMEDRCVVCREKWGQYRCGTTGADVCSLECKAINLIRCKAAGAGTGAPPSETLSTGANDSSTVSLTDLHSIDYATLSGPPVCTVCQGLAL